VAFRRKIRRINKSDRLEIITSDGQRNFKTIEQEQVKTPRFFADVGIGFFQLPSPCWSI
jgi:hypothetical protein